MTITNIESILVILLVIDAITLVVLVLIQQGKGADVGAAFGSGSSSTVFGAAGSASFMARLTAWLAIGFFALSFALAYTAKERADGLSDVGMPTVSLPLETPAAAGTPDAKTEIEAEAELGTTADKVESATTTNSGDEVPNL